ncbi:Single-stranded DNA-binding protein [Corynebacterium atrinae]|uniref:single-stranded DNA-binding protein n=1 Tax=Corynebacterium atrinae TaxID=1336740 RepID=UPI0025B46D1B|nr:single-stranded DNA-binding protein [Corynebacterium atrinae]WJY64066.1 Single-stranded DNA-binding protein [Corynebacterium atrinae]
MAHTTTTIIGNLTHDPKLQRFERSGAQKCSLRIASSRRVQDKDNNWIDIDQMFLSVDVWGPLAINCKKSLSKGMPVIVHGTLITHQWEDEHNQKRSKTLMRANSVGLDLNKYIIGSMKVDNAEKNLINVGIPDPQTADTLYDEIVADQSDPAERPSESLPPLPAAPAPPSHGGCSGRGDRRGDGDASLLTGRGRSCTLVRDV